MLLTWGFFVSLICLGIGTYFDVFNKRMVPDIIWSLGIVVGIIGFLLTDSLSVTSLKIAEITGIFILSFIVVRLGFLGGADAQALILLTFLLPIGESLFIMNNSFLVAGFVMPIYFIYNKISFRNWGNFKMPFILFMYLGTLAHIVIGNWFLNIIL
jgi:Flp pilus assembly protein protease CpaA